MEIPGFAQKAALLDKEPNFAFEYIVDLLSFVRDAALYGSRALAWRT